MNTEYLNYTTLGNRFFMLDVLDQVDFVLILTVH